MKKTIAGPAAGSQGPWSSTSVCDGTALTRDRSSSPPVRAAGDTSKTYDDIPAGTMCTVTETSDGSTGGTDGGRDRGRARGDDPSGRSATAHITDTYDFVPGSLLVTKTIAGPGAGQQGEIRIHTECDGKALTPDFVIPAGTPAGDQTKQYDQIPAPATCTVTETADGHTSTVSVVVDGSGQTVSVPAGEIAEADISDTYGLVPGQLEVTKTIAGPAAGQQGRWSSTRSATGPPSRRLRHPGRGASGRPVADLHGIPTPAAVWSPRPRTAHTSTVVGRRRPAVRAHATIPAGGAGAATSRTPTASPPARCSCARRSPVRARVSRGVTIHSVCDGTALTPDFVIPAGTPAGDQSQRYDASRPADCTVTETADGHTSAVSVVVDGERAEGDRPGR